MRRVRLMLGFAVVVLSATLFSIAAFAQGGSATLNGRVTDTAGLVVAGASVQAVNVNLNTVSTAETNKSGLYTIPALHPGTYRVVVDKEGFERIVKPGIDLHVADVVSLNFNLQVGSTAQTITVEGGAPVVETTSSSLGGLVNDEKMADLPLNGRNYIDLSLMQAGITQNRNNSLGGMTGTIFSSNGAPTISNNFLLDGTSIVNQSGWTGSSIASTTLGVDGIKEYKVITNAFSAEYGMTMGSQMLIVSKGGSNQFHGDAFEYLRNSAMNARNFFDGPKIPQFEKNNFGGSFGGPIKKDKTFFYGVYEQLNIKLGFSVLSTVPAAACHPTSAGQAVWNGQGVQPAGSVGPCAQLGSNPAGAGTISLAVNSITAPFMALYPTPTGSIVSNGVVTPTFSFPATDNQRVYYGQMRVDHNFSDKDALFARYTTDASNAVSPLPSFSSSATGGAAFPQWGSEGESRDQYLTLSENHIFSNALLSTARISFARTNFFTVPTYLEPTPGVPSFVVGQPMGTVSVTGLSSIGDSGTLKILHLQNIYTVADDVYYTKGKNGFKFGALINRYNQSVTGTLLAGSITYPSLANFFNAVPSKYTAPTPGSNFNRDFIYNTLGFYAQDDWHAAQRLTFNLGLRYEFITTPWELNNNGYAIRDHALDATPTQGPIFVNATKLNFSPRVGLAWDVLGDGKTSVRSAFGIYYDVGNYGNLFTQNSGTSPPVSSSTSVTNTSAVITFPFVFTPQQLGKTLGTYVDYNSTQPHILQFNLSIERQLPANTALTIAYVHTRGAHLWTAREGNPSIPTYIGPGNTDYWSNSLVACENSVPSCRINPNYLNDQLSATVSDSWYNALQITVNKRVSRGLEFQAAYTYAHSVDTTEGNLSVSDCSAPGMDESSDPNFLRRDAGPSCFDIRHNLRFNMLYHFPNVKSNSFLTKFSNGWWISSIVSVQSGYPFTPLDSINRSNSGVLENALSEKVNLGTAMVAAKSSVTDAFGNAYTSANVNFVPFDANSVITGNPNQWFNPLMFALQPMVPCPGAGNAGLTCGILGNSPRGLLRGPGLGDWDFSLVKDTAVHILGEGGAIQFRAEFFNILNRANFGMPSGTIFPAKTADLGSYSEAPVSTAGQITTTSTTARQIQLALKVLF